MPNKTIYVSDADLPVFERAQELTGGNLSAAISKGLRRLVEVEEGNLAGYDEITVKVGTGAAKRLQRFQGSLLAEWNRTTPSGGEERFRVYRTRAGRFAVHLQKSKEFVHSAGKDGQLTGWRKHLSSDQQWGEVPASASLTVFDNFDELKASLPAELAAIVAPLATEPEVEDLDI